MLKGLLPGAVTWAEWTRHVRERTGLTPAQFSARLGISVRQLVHLERGDAWPSLTLRRLLEFVEAMPTVALESWVVRSEAPAGVFVGPLRRGVVFGRRDVFYPDHDFIDYELRSDHRVGGQIISAGTRVKSRRVDGWVEHWLPDGRHWRQPYRVVLDSLQVPYYNLRSWFGPRKTEHR